MAGIEWAGKKSYWVEEGEEGEMAEQKGGRE